MPILHLVDQDRRHVRTTVAGQVTAADIVRHLDDAQREGTLDYTELIDVSQVTPPFMSSAEIWQVARRVISTVKSRRCGPRAVVVSNITIFGLVRMFATIVADVFPMNVFRDPVRAEAWLAEQSAIS